MEEKQKEALIQQDLEEHTAESLQQPQIQKGTHVSRGCGFGVQEQIQETVAGHQQVCANENSKMWVLTINGVSLAPNEGTGMPGKSNQRCKENHSTFIC